MVGTIENIPTRVYINGQPMPREWNVFFDSLVRNINNSLTSLETKIDKYTTGTAGNLIKLTSDGGITDAGQSAVTLEATPADFVSQVGAASTVTVAAGADTIDLAQLNADLVTLVGSINDIRNTVNSISTAMINAGLMESS